jgi:hypothetical protein
MPRQQFFFAPRCSELTAIEALNNPELMKKLSASKLLSVFLISGFASASWAASVEFHEKLDDLIVKAPLIFEGRVVSLAYKNSQPNQQHPQGLPHTFVTYKVERGLFGKAPSTFVLRFFGGLHPDGRAMAISSYPQIDIGDHDVLLVDGNTVVGCPLVNCGQGRIRISDGLAFTEEGRALVKAAANSASRFGFGAFRPIPEVLTQVFVHPQTLKQAVVTIRGDGSGQEPAPDKNPVSLSDLIRIVEELKKGQRPTSVVPSADPQGLIPAISLSAKPTRPSPPGLQPIGPIDAAEAAEIAAVEKNGGNPVLKKGGN